MPTCKTSQGPVFYQLEGQGSPLMLLHADGSAGAEFDPVMPRLRELFHVARLDLPGCGRSPRRAFSIEYYEENAKAALDVAKKLFHQAIPVIGVGGGAVSAIWMALLAPAQVQAIAADSFAEFYEEDDIRRDLAAHHEPSEEMISFWREMNGNDYSTVIKELDRLFAQMAESKQSVFDGRLEELSCPVLLTGSRQDHLISNAASRMLQMFEQIKNARLLLYGNGGHPAMWSNSSSFWRDALAFLAEASTPTDAQQRPSP